MKKTFVLLNVTLLAIVLIFGAVSCKKDSTTTTFAVASMTAGGVNLNTATAPSNVPPDATIEVVYNMNVSQTSVVNKIFLVRNYDNDTIPVTVAVAGAKITIQPGQGLGNGALYQLFILPGIISTDGQAVGAITRSFTTAGSFAPNGVIAYWNFENNANDQVGTFSPTAAGVIDLTFANSYSTAAGQAGEFNGTTTLVEIPNGDQLDATDDFTLSFWVKADSTKHGQFVMGLAGWFGFQFEIAGDYSSCKMAAQYRFGDGTSGSEDLWFNGEGLTATSWQGWTFSKDLTTSGGVKFIIANKWTHVVCRYNSANKKGTMYLNGDKVKEQDFNLWPAGDIKLTVAGLKYAGNPGNNNFVFGFIQDKTDPTITDPWAQYSDIANNHFKGLLDDVRIFHKALTEQEIQLMYASEKP